MISLPCLQKKRISKLYVLIECGKAFEKGVIYLFLVQVRCIATSHQNFHDSQQKTTGTIVVQLNSSFFQYALSATKKAGCIMNFPLHIYVDARVYGMQLYTVCMQMCIIHSLIQRNITDNELKVCKFYSVTQMGLHLL